MIHCKHADRPCRPAARACITLHAIARAVWRQDLTRVSEDLEASPGHREPVAVDRLHNKEPLGQHRRCIKRSTRMMRMAVSIPHGENDGLHCTRAVGETSMAAIQARSSSRADDTARDKTEWWRADSGAGRSPSAGSGTTSKMWATAPSFIRTRSPTARLQTHVNKDPGQQIATHYSLNYFPMRWWCRSWRWWW